MEAELRKIEEEKKNADYAERMMNKVTLLTSQKKKRGQWLKKNLALNFSRQMKWLQNTVQPGILHAKAF